VALLRILVDGYSLIHAWPDLAPGQPRHSEAARTALVSALTKYGDAAGVPVTVFFDGGGAPRGVPKEASTPNMEVIFSPAGNTADDLIERVACRIAKHGDALVVTNDYAEQDTVRAFGCGAIGCEEFILDVHAALREFSDSLERHNRRERKRYRSGK
jgi:predicted RNA-binding protein with PIN domain